MSVVELRYDPSQPRADDGKWTDIGGNGTADPSAPLVNADGDTIQEVGKRIPEKRDPDDVLDDWMASDDEIADAKALAAEKARNVPEPTQAQIDKNLKALKAAKRGGRAGGELRGNSYTRRERADALFREFGGHERGYCPCTSCGIKVSPRGEGGHAVMQQDKILVATEGGTYGTPTNFPNLIPSCGGCNSSRNDEEYPVRPNWQLAVTSTDNRVAARALGRPVGWDDPTLDANIVVEGPYYTRQADTWFGTYEQHLIGGETCDPATIEILDADTAQLAFDQNQPRDEEGQWTSVGYGGDRTGNPEVDAVIEEFLAEPLGDWTTDDTPIGEMDAAACHGSCDAVAEQFKEFAEARGLKVYATQTDASEMGYEISGPAHGEVMDNDGNIVEGHYFEHTVNEIYVEGQAFPYTVDFTARQYGYDTPVKVTFAGGTVELAVEQLRFNPNQPRDAEGRWTGSAAGAIPRNEGAPGSGKWSADPFNPNERAGFTSKRPVWVGSNKKGTFFYVEATGPDGEMHPIRLNRQSGARTPMQDTLDMMNAAADAYEANPSSQVPLITIPAIWPQDASTVAFVMPGPDPANFSTGVNQAFFEPREIVVNDNPDLWSPDAHAAFKEITMPESGVSSMIDYVITHEYGHVRMALGDDRRVETRRIAESIMRRGGLDMSTYGQQQWAESHAEAFAEWTMTNGETSNLSARLFARDLRWPNAPEFHENVLEDAIAASAGVDMEHFLKDPLVCLDGPAGPQWVFETVGGTETFRFDPNQPRVPAGSTGGGQWGGGQARRIPPPPRFTPRPAAQRPPGVLADVPFRDVKIAYRPRHPDGKADPGEVVWAQVPFEEDPSRSKDRPVLIIGRTKDGKNLVGVQLTSKSGHGRVPVGTGDWDRSRRESYMDTDRFIQVDDANYRREGAYLTKPRFQQIVDTLTERQHAPDVDLAARLTVFRYNPDQPRVPAGSSEGGQWGGGPSAPTIPGTEDPAVRSDGVPFRFNDVESLVDQYDQANQATQARRIKHEGAKTVTVYMGDEDKQEIADELNAQTLSEMDPILRIIVAQDVENDMRDFGADPERMPLGVAMQMSSVSKAWGLLEPSYEQGEAFQAAVDAYNKGGDPAALSALMEESFGISVAHGAVDWRNQQWQSSAVSPGMVAFHLAAAQRYGLHDAQRAMNGYYPSGSMEQAQQIGKLMPTTIGHVLTADQFAIEDTLQMEVRRDNRDTITVYRGVKDTGHMATNYGLEGVNTTQGNPLSSWTVDLNTARGFAGQHSTNGGYILAAEVPVNQIAGIAAVTGWGSTAEREVILLGNPVTLTEITPVNRD